MPTTYDTFLARTIADGIAAAEEDYAHDPAKREGGADAMKRTRQASIDVHEKRIASSDYWRIRCFEAEVEWVANVVSAALVNQGQPPIAGHLPTARGYIKAAGIVGVRGQE